MRFPVLVALLVAVCATAFAGGRAGKVVRVERKPEAVIGSPRYCTISPSDNIGYCITQKPPEVGERLTIVDSAHVLGTIRITTVTPLTDGCQQSTSWMTQGTLETGDLTSPNGAIIGVLDVSLDLRGAKLINVDKSPTGHAWGNDTVYAIDNNADGNPELEFVQYGCDDAGSYSVQPSSMCSEVWSLRSGKALERVRSERMRTCY